MCSWLRPKTRRALAKPRCWTCWISAPFSLGLVIQQVFDNGSIYNPAVRDITEETAFPLPGGCPQCSQPMPADWLPDCCICTPFCHQWVQVGPGFVCGDWLHLPTCWKGQGLLGWSICILWLLPPPQPRPRLKQRKSQRSPTRIWDSVSLTNHQKAANPASIICEMRK